MPRAQKQWVLKKITHRLDKNNLAIYFPKSAPKYHNKVSKINHEYRTHPSTSRSTLQLKPNPHTQVISNNNTISTDIKQKCQILPIPTRQCKQNKNKNKNARLSTNWMFIPPVFFVCLKSFALLFLKNWKRKDGESFPFWSDLGSDLQNRLGFSFD